MALAKNSSLQILQSKAPTISSISRSQGESIARVILTNLITDLALSFNLSQNMSVGQVWALSELLIQEFHNFKIPDFKKCFNNAILGKYGQLYNRLDGQVISLWLQEYDKERVSEIEEFRIQEASMHKHNAKTLDPEIAGLLSNMLKSKPIEQKTIKRERTKNEKLMDSFIAQFDKLHRKQELVIGGMKFINRYWKTLSLDDFLTYKLEQHKRIKHKQNENN